MDANYLQDIVDKLSPLQPSQYRDAEQLKIHAVEALKQLFPREGILAVKMDHLHFKPTIGVGDQYNRDQFLNAKNTLTSTLTAKILVLKQLPITKSISEAEQNNNLQASIITQQESTISQYNTALKAANKQLEGHTSRINELKAEVNLLRADLSKKRFSAMFTNGTFWSIIGAFLIGVPLWTFDKGKDFGFQRVDEVRLQQKDSIQVLIKAINYMRHNSDSAQIVLEHMPYREMSLDSTELLKVQSTIEKAGIILHLNSN